MRPFFRWLLFTLCLLVFTGALGWISLRMLDMEKERQVTDEDAQVQEKIRLALWRMDSLASALLIRENSRPAYHYQAFYAPDDLFANRTQSIPKGQALMPSPLFGSLPDLVQLHFEKISGQTELTSPQAPAGNQKQLATSWYTLSPQTGVADQKLAVMKTLLEKHPEIRQVPTVGASQMIEVKTSAAQEKENFDKALSPRSKNDLQIASNSMEQSQRALILDNSIALEKQTPPKPQLKKALPAPAVKTSKAESTMGSGSAVTRSSPQDQKLDEVAQRYQSQAPRASVPAQVAAEEHPSRPALPALAGDLRPAWVEKELVLIRNATVEGSSRLQGVWLDWAQLQIRLLDTIRDLIPEARLVAVSPEEARTDATSLVTLPVKLLPGRVPVTQSEMVSPLKPVLILAWACLLAATLAIGFVLHRAVMLSERRGAFVSAVTHELRTPLTTFRLYSEMLADDMVPDASQRRSYLQTLCDESTRLMHLVENVLAYSRIERGRTAGRMETISVNSLLDRIVPRLRQRTDQVNLDLQLHAGEDLAAARVRVDVMAVEQILFNLTDNACKYAAPDCDPRRLLLSVSAQASEVRFTLRDYGPGLPRAQKKRLFQPFSKSATEAAHSAPGVGLGLALSRRLARELGGDLFHQVPEGRGAEFVLTVRKDTAH